MSDQPKTWREMTDAEKGALLLAHHEGKEIQLHDDKWVPVPCPIWDDDTAYRVKPEPVEEIHRIPLAANGFVYDPTRHGGHAAYEITYRKIDGKPDFTSVKMGVM